MNALRGIKVALFVVDEAHCISEVLQVKFINSITAEKMQGTDVFFCHSLRGSRYAVLIALSLSLFVTG